MTEINLTTGQFTGVVTHQLGRLSFLPRFVRLCVYKYGILPLSTCYERWLLNRATNFLYGRCGLGSKGNYNVERARSMQEALIELGGVENTLVPRDGEAKIQVINLKAGGLRTKIESLGGVWEKRKEEIVICGPEKNTDEWNEFYTSSLKKLFKEERIEDGKAYLVTSKNADSIPFNDTERKTECILFSRLGKSFVMDKNEIAHFLGMGLDVCLYDARGVFNSEGYPSEGGLYNDIEEVFAHLKTNQGYSSEKICVYGECGE